MITKIFKVSFKGKNTGCYFEHLWHSKERADKDAKDIAALGCENVIVYVYEMELKDSYSVRAAK